MVDCHFSNNICLNNFSSTKNFQAKCPKDSTPYGLLNWLYCLVEEAQVLHENRQ